MKLDYRGLEREMGMKLYNPDLPSKLIGIAHEYAKTVSANNEKIFTGELIDGTNVIKYPKDYKERMRSQRFAINAKMKIVERYLDIFNKDDILLAMISYRP